MDIYDRIVEQLEIRKMSRRQLAQRAGIPPATLNSAFARRNTKLSYEMVQKLAETLDVTTDYLIGLTDSPDERMATQADMDAFAGGNVPLMPIAESEARMLDMYRRLSLEQRSRIDMLIRYDYDNLVAELNKEESTLDAKDTLVTKD